MGLATFNSRFLSAVPLRCSVVQESARTCRKLFRLRNDFSIPAPSFPHVPGGYWILDTHKRYLLFVLPTPLPSPLQLSWALWLHSVTMWKGKRCFQRLDPVHQPFPLIISQWFFDSMHIGDKVKSWEESENIHHVPWLGLVQKVISSFLPKLCIWFGAV